MLENEDLRRAFGQSSREAVERYRWGNVAEAVIALYGELIDGTPARGVAAYRN